MHTIKALHRQKCLLMRATATLLKILSIKTTHTVQCRPTVSTVPRPDLQMAVTIRAMETMKVRLKIKTKYYIQQSMANFAGSSLFEIKPRGTGVVSTLRQVI